MYTIKYLSTCMFLSVCVACGGAKSSPSSGLSPHAPEVEDTLLQLANKERLARGLNALSPHSQLHRAALGHSHDMAQHRFLAHDSPTSGTPADRTLKAGIRSGLVLENVGKGPRAELIHQGWMQSPGHQANLLNPDVTDIGVAAIPVQDDTGKNYIATQLFAQLAKEIEVRGAPLRLLGLLNQSRDSRGVDPLQMDKHLQELAQMGADRFFSDISVSQQGVIEGATSKKQKFASNFKRVAGVMTVVPTLRSASALEPALDSTVKYIGVGIAQGNRPDTGPRAIAVVLLLAWIR